MKEPEFIDKIIWERIKEKKKKLDSLRPFSVAVLKQLKERMAIELTYNSNAIEGNTLTLKETKLVIEQGLTIKGKSLREHFEVINHKEALDFLETLLKKKKTINTFMIRQFHSLILAKINEKEAGKYRDCPVRITGTKFVPSSPIEITPLMGEFNKWLKKTARVLNPIEYAGLAHLKLVSIHPFIDGNGRVSRLLMNLILMKWGFPPTIILNVDRKRYYRTLERAQIKNEVRDFLNFIARAVERSLNLYLEALSPIKSRKELKEKKYISLSEASKFSPYSQEYLSLLARQGKLDAIKIDRNWWITREALKKYIKTQSRKFFKKYEQ